jgi:hypothetical protein
MTLLKCGFDKTRFDGPQTWQKILDRCHLTYRGELPEMKGFEWRCDNRLLVVTGDNPITGLCRIPALNENPCNIVPGVAGYIGIEGLAEDVLDFVGLVFMEADNIKAFNARERAYI